MDSTDTTISLLILLSLLAGCSDPLPADTACARFDIGPDDVFIQGRVIAQDLPVAGAEVEMTGPNGTTLSTVTGRSGCFLIEAAPGLWHGDVTAAGYEQRSFNTPDLQPPRVYTVDIVMPMRA